MPHLYGSLGCPAFRMASISQSAMALHSYRFRLSRAQNDAQESMRSSANFHPEWGYLAPAPSFIRRARVVLIATAVGVTFSIYKQQDGGAAVWMEGWAMPLEKAIEIALASGSA